MPNDIGMTNDGKLELSLMHFHHTNPKWQMPKHCEDYLEKIQEHGKAFDCHSSHHSLSFSHGEYLHICCSSTILQSISTKLVSSFDHQSIFSSSLAASMISKSSSDYTHFAPLRQTENSPDQHYRTLAPFGVLSR